jgi:hypothetical protein
VAEAHLKIECSGSDDDYVGSLKPLGPFFDRKLDLLALFEGTKTVGFNGGIVDKDVWAIFTLNEAVALATVEPLDGSGKTLRHAFNSLCEKDWEVLGAFVGGSR